MPRMSHADLIAYEARRARRPAVAARPDDGPESALHEHIIARCKTLGWHYVHARMDRRSSIGIGCCDFYLFAPCGRVVCVECKAKNGKMTTEQLGVRAHLLRLGFEHRIVRSLEEAMALFRDGGAGSESTWNLMSEIRRAAGDPDGLLMQDELVERIRNAVSALDAAGSAR